jgi:O-methyltransferase
VKANVGACGYPAERIRYVVGVVEDTLPTQTPSEIALLRLDQGRAGRPAPALVRGGILIIDDYGAYEEAHKAPDEYFAENGITFFLGRVDEHVRISVKQLARRLRHPYQGDRTGSLAAPVRGTSAALA